MSEYKRGDRVVVNSGNVRGVAGTVVAQSKVTRSLTIKLDMPNDRERVVNVMPYEVQREEVWNETHPPTDEPDMKDDGLFQPPQLLFPEEEKLTLRDELAARALPGLIAKYGDNADGQPLWLTDKAYRLADAMLVSRKRKL